MLSEEIINSSSHLLTNNNNDSTNHHASTSIIDHSLPQATPYPIPSHTKNFKTGTLTSQQETQQSIISNSLLGNAVHAASSTMMMMAMPTMATTTTTATSNLLLQPSPNIEFNPKPTTSGKCPKLKAVISLDSTVFVAGGTLDGRLELECTSSSKVKLGRIWLELNAYEELNEKENAQSQSFLASDISIQGARRPPSPAVFGPMVDGYWQAFKKKTIFPFSFQLPEDSPSSFQFETTAYLKYVVTAIIDFEYKNKKDSLITSKEACVLERLNKSMLQINRPLKFESFGKVFLGGSGYIHLVGMIPKTVYCSGDNLYVGIKVRNDTRRTIQGIKLALVRKLMMLKVIRGIETVQSVIEVVKECSFQQQAFSFHPKEERSLMVNIHIPNALKTVQNTALSQVLCYLKVSVDVGYFSKPIFIEFPIEIYHPSTFDPPPMLNTHVYEKHPHFQPRLPFTSTSPTTTTTTRLNGMSSLQQNDQSFRQQQKHQARWAASPTSRRSGLQESFMNPSSSLPLENNEQRQQQKLRVLPWLDEDMQKEKQRHDELAKEMQPKFIEGEDSIDYYLREDPSLPNAYIPYMLRNNPVFEQVKALDEKISFSTPCNEHDMEALRILDELSKEEVIDFRPDVEAVMEENVQEIEFEREQSILYEIMRDVDGSHSASFIKKSVVYPTELVENVILSQIIEEKPLPEPSEQIPKTMSISSNKSSLSPKIAEYIQRYEQAILDQS